MIPELFHGLCDDAALFPPGNAPLDVAVPQHLRYRCSDVAELVGPFVFPIPRLPELRDVPAPIEVSLTAPGGPSTALAGIDAASAIDGVTVVAIEIALPGDTTAVQELSSLQGPSGAIDVYVEIPRDDRRPAVLDAVATSELRAKFRTGGVTADAYPSEDELADAIVSVVARKIPFKATAGLHHAIRNTGSTGFEQHGYLNLLLAAQSAADGADRNDVARILADRDGASVAERVQRLSAPRVFGSFGTCSITEPLDDLDHLGLLRSTA